MILCVVCSHQNCIIEPILMRTLNHYFIEDPKDNSNLLIFAFWPGGKLNPQGLELRMSRTNLHDQKDVRVIEIRTRVFVSQNMV